MFWSKWVLKKKYTDLIDKKQMLVI